MVLHVFLLPAGGKLTLLHPNVCVVFDFRMVASCTPPQVAGCQIVLTADDPPELWLTNFGTVSATVGPMELFGFNVGSFVEKPQGNLSKNIQVSYFNAGKQFFVL